MNNFFGQATWHLSLSPKHPWFRPAQSLLAPERLELLKSFGFGKSVTAPPGESIWVCGPCLTSPTNNTVITEAPAASASAFNPHLTENLKSLSRCSSALLLFLSSEAKPSQCSFTRRKILSSFDSFSSSSSFLSSSTNSTVGSSSLKLSMRREMLSNFCSKWPKLVLTAKVSSHLLWMEWTRPRCSKKTGQSVLPWAWNAFMKRIRIGLKENLDSKDCCEKEESWALTDHGGLSQSLCLNPVSWQLSLCKLLSMRHNKEYSLILNFRCLPTLYSCPMNALRSQKYGSKLENT